jgi:hypothetical protein
VSVRDPRDCVTSLMLYQRYRFAPALATVERSARACAQWAGDARTMLLRYEAGFIDRPDTLESLAASFGGTLSGEDRARIFAETRRPAIEAQIARLPELPTSLRHEPSGDVVDLVTQWHTHHARRSGEVGRWRHMLSVAETAAVEQQLSDWMACFSYRPEIAPLARAVGSEPLRL